MSVGTIAVVIVDEPVLDFEQKLMEAIEGVRFLQAYPLSTDPIRMPAVLDSLLAATTQAMNELNPSREDHKAIIARLQSATDDFQ